MLFVAGWWQGHKKFEWGLAGTVALSFLGVALLMRPSLNAEQLLGGAISLASGVLSALVYLQVRKLGLLGEPEYRVVFYFCHGRLGRPGRQRGDGPRTAVAQPLLDRCAAGAHDGLTATTAQIAMTRAYRLGNTLVTANLQYTGIVFSSLFGVLIWDDAPGWIGWLGMAIILASGMLATYRNQRKSQAAAKNVPKVDPIATEV
jgi:S-adenosylmethionine uptake transporter